MNPPDITGNGKPDLLLGEHPGGDLFGYLLLEMDGGQLNEVIRLPSRSGSWCEDVDQDGVWEYYCAIGPIHEKRRYMQRLDTLIRDPGSLVEYDAESSDGLPSFP